MRPPTHTIARRLLGAAGALTLAAVTLSAPAAAAEEPPRRPYQQVKICDLSMCYIAWRVIDSDGDGYCDADELVARTDPFDRNSFPSPQLLAELAVGRSLPSFEYGQGVFVLLPLETIKLREQVDRGWTESFPLPTRKDSLARMGVDAKLLDAFGLDPNSDGLTLGLDLPGSGGSGLPAGIKLGSLDISLISAGGGASFAANRGGVKNNTRDDDGFGDVTEYYDGSTAHTRVDKDTGTTDIAYTNPDGSNGPVVTIERDFGYDGDTRVETETTTVTGADGRVESVSTTVTRTEPDGSRESQTDKTTYKRDEDGEVTGTVVTHSESSTPAGGTTTSGHTTSRCDENGQNCTQVGSSGGYFDESQAPVAVTEEMIQGVLKVRGAAINVVQGWTPPGDGNPEAPDPSVIVNIDPDYVGEYVLVEPKLTTHAQPRYANDLPHPMDGAPFPPTGGCGGLC
ncbi:thrombospondin type 3 repeat-containing protein [Catellatospora vulcania]|uniref:thrombospondin type 3 repeat-containing protein n=1 Tax=Catellatospora vulcania TaxID=1460450 RepID=UPI0012D4030D|nr:thrombospondin type 3 repeat-containing protein [Catellatospora vulcania]